MTNFHKENFANLNCMKGVAWLTDRQPFPQHEIGVYMQHVTCQMICHICHTVYK